MTDTAPGVTTLSGDRGSADIELETFNGDVTLRRPGEMKDEDN